MPKNRFPSHEVACPGAPPPPKTRYQLHVERWQGGCGSPNCDRAKRKVLFKGDVPCHVLVIGEGPGESEDVLGRPFVGPAGKVLDRIIARATHGKPVLRWGYTNLVACIPRDPEDPHKKAKEPEDEDILCCGERLKELMRVADGITREIKLIVHVGKLSEEYMEPGLKRSVSPHRSIPRVSITHPAAILRAEYVKQGLLEQRCVVNLSDALDLVLAHLNNGEK